MVETPAAALMSDKIAKLVDFMSFGTNDLTQYTLAIDRAAEEVPEFFDHCHPAVLRLIKFTIEKTKDKNVELSVCGESASDIYAVPILIGLGIRKLSASPTMIPIIKYLIRQLDLESMENLANRALEMEEPEEVREMVKKFYDGLNLALPLI